MNEAPAGRCVVPGPARGLRLRFDRACPQWNRPEPAAATGLLRSTTDRLAVTLEPLHSIPIGIAGSERWRSSRAAPEAPGELPHHV